MEFPRQEYWSGLPFPPPGDLPTQASVSGLLCCRQTLLSEPPGKPFNRKDAVNSVLGGGSNPDSPGSQVSWVLSFSGRYLLSDLGAVFSDSVTP